jgi:membrane protein DedA with SNARE-associated domain
MVEAGEYAALLLLASVGGLGVPGPGDSALIAAALLAADGHLWIVWVLLFAFTGCLTGRFVGYELGLRGGRSLLTRPGWFEGFRTRAVAKGDDLFKRYPRTAVWFAPSPLSGVHRVPVALFALASVGVALTWSLSTGLISYLIGEQAKDLLGTAGVKGVLVIVILAGVGLVYRYLWRRRLRRHAEPPDPLVP